MKFTSLEDAFQANYIKSIPVLTHLDLIANEIKLIELILSYTRTGKQFYMNYADIANYLVVSKGKTKAKVVEKIVRRLCKAGYITKVTTANFNGKNGGSSANIQVDETFLEEQLHRVFNPERFQIEPAHETIPIAVENIAIANLEPVTELQDIIAPKTLIEELEEMDALEDDVKYIDASLAAVVIADGVMVKVIDGLDISTAEDTEPDNPELLPIETIKNKLRTMINHERYQGKESDIRTMLTAFDHKTVEEFNGFFNHILESVSKA